MCIVATIALTRQRHYRPPTHRLPFSLFFLPPGAHRRFRTLFLHLLHHASLWTCLAVSLATPAPALPLLAQSPPQLTAAPPDARTERLSQRRSRAFESQHDSHFWDLCVVSCVLHTMAPRHLVPHLLSLSFFFKQKLPADLPVVSPPDHVSSAFQRLIYGPDHGAGERVLHVLWVLAAEAESANHT